MTVRAVVQSAVRAADPLNMPTTTNNSGARQTSIVNQGLDSMSPSLTSSSSRMRSPHSAQQDSFAGSLNREMAPIFRASAIVG